MIRPLRTDDQRKELWRAGKLENDLEGAFRPLICFHTMTHKSKFFEMSLNELLNSIFINEFLFA